ncbi:MAG: hypothetical protein KBC72_04860 [Acinetobacter sp.]|nr:hypothetical protein [Acinetobacter sp.]
MTTTDSKINQLFNNLDTWRHLPNYQLERRADIFFSLYLAEVLQAQKDLGLDGEIIIIPEFPCRKGTVDVGSESNRSFKIDYLVASQMTKKAYFVELKTDNSSIAQRQIENMNKACKIDLGTLTSAISKEIKPKSYYGSKYDYLIEKTKKFEKWNDVKPRMIFIVPIEPSSGSPIYKIPSDQSTIVTFDKFITVAKSHSECPVSKRFAESLVKWQAKAGSDQ